MTSVSWSWLAPFKMLWLWQYVAVIIVVNRGYFLNDNSHEQLNTSFATTKINFYSKKNVSFSSWQFLSFWTLLSVVHLACLSWWDRNAKWWSRLLAAFSSGPIEGICVGGSQGWSWQCVTIPPSYFNDSTIILPKECSATMTAKGFINQQFGLHGAIAKV